MESKPLSLKIGVSGVRGIVGESLTPQLVTSFCAAFGSYSGSGPIVIGTDTRLPRGRWSSKPLSLDSSASAARQWT
jgi:phosphomannomutase